MDDFHKPGVYRSGGARASARDLFRGTPFRGCRGRWDAVVFLVCFECGGVSRLFFFVFPIRTQTACCKYVTSLPHLPFFLSIAYNKRVKMGGRDELTTSAINNVNESIVFYSGDDDIRLILS